MADKAQTSISASILLDEIKSGLSGSLNYEPAAEIATGSGEGWVYVERLVNHTAANQLLGASSSPASDYIGQQGGYADTDLVMWVAIKNPSTTATDGIGIGLASGTVPDFEEATAMYIGAGEILVLKLGNTTAANLVATSVTMDGTYGYASAAHTGSLSIIVAAIVKNV